MTARQRGLATAFALVCALHGLLLWGLRMKLLSSEGAAWHAPAVSTRWLPPTAVQNDEAPASAHRAQARSPARSPAHSAVSTPAVDTAVTEAQPAEPLVANTAAPEPALRADAVHRAARDAARRKGLAELSDDKLGQHPVDAQAALRSGMASAARTDCLKGGEEGYARSGLGLFALPVLIYDAASGRCSK